eukprot:s1692_g8.t1
MRAGTYDYVYGVKFLPPGIKPGDHFGEKSEPNKANTGFYYIAGRQKPRLVTKIFNISVDWCDRRPHLDDQENFWDSLVAIFMYLAVWKYRLSKQLGSQVLRKDALCSVLGAFLALICAIAAMLEQVIEGNPKAVSGIDATAGLGIALMLGFEGLRTLKHNLWDWETEHRELA